MARAQPATDSLVKTENPDTLVFAKSFHVVCIGYVYGSAIIYVFGFGFRSSRLFKGLGRKLKAAGLPFGRL